MKTKFINILSALLAFVMFMSISVSANKGKKTDSAVRFYIDCFEDGTLFNVLNVSSSLANDIKLDSDFELSIGGDVTEDTILSYVTKEPDSDKVFKKLQKLAEENDYSIYTESGITYKISELNEENFDIEWYCMYYDGHWCINGRIIDLNTKESISIGDKEDDEIDLPKYTSNFAYIFGYNDTTMGAEGSLLRCEVSAMIHRLAKQNNKLGGFSYNESNPPVFSDIEGEWFRSAIEYMEYKKAFDKKRGTNINPHVAVTRGEAFKLICIGLGFTEDTSLPLDQYAQIMLDAGYVQGDENGELNISQLISRAEFCAVYNRVTGRDKAKLITADGEEITSSTYGFTDLSEDEWYYETMLKATSAYDENGYVDIEQRGVRNNLDDYK